MAIINETTRQCDHCGVIGDYATCFKPFEKDGIDYCQRCTLIDEIGNFEDCIKSINTWLEHIDNPARRARTIEDRDWYVSRVTALKAKQEELNAKST